jgi:hypothetical protein
MAIDASVVLGLAGKATDVFAEPDTYLSFPFAPYGFDQSRLRALVDDPMSAEGLQALAEFSLLVNEVPNSQIWQPDSADRLWDIYGDVLDAVELAELPRTAEEEADYRRAFDLLYETSPEGTVVDSEIVLTYEQHRDAYTAASQEYNNRKGQAGTTTDPAVKAQWGVDEPLLLERVAEAEQDWAVAGHRGEVDDARRLIRELGSRAPVMVWSGYRKLFDPDLPEISFRTSAEGWAFVPTAYLPSDVVDLEWPTISVSRSDLPGLAEKAPEELRSRLAGGSNDGLIESVSFEYSSVTVSRPWFAPEAFGSRAWRFYEPNRVLSDGGTPPTGECTAYVRGLVLARKITIRRRSGQRSVNLGFLSTRRIPVPSSFVRPYPTGALLERMNIRRAAVVRAAIPTETAEARVTVRDHRAAIPHATRDHRGASPSGQRPLRVAAVAAAVARPELSVARPAAADPLPLVISRVSRLHPPVEAVAIAQPPSAGEQTSDPNDIYIIAFICRLLPKAPDPDPSFTW